MILTEEMEKETMQKKIEDLQAKVDRLSGIVATLTDKMDRLSMIVGSLADQLPAFEDIRTKN